MVIQGCELVSGRVSVVVPARNEEQSIARCLASIVSQNIDDLEALVIDGNSSDGTVRVVQELAAADPRIRLIHNPQAVVPVSLNLALRQATGEWLVRVDAHSEIPAGYVRRAVAHLETGRWGGVGGRKQAVGVTHAGKAVAAAMGSRFGVGNSTYHYGREMTTVDHIPFGAYPVALARSLGGWDERLVVNQDFEFDHRVHQAGYEMLFDPDLVIKWRCRQSVRALFRQYKRYGRGKAKVATLHPESVRVRHLMAPALVAAGTVIGIAAPLRPRWALVAATPYAVAVGAASVLAAPHVHGARAKAFLPAAFTAMHVGWGMGFWFGLIDVAQAGGVTSGSVSSPDG